tara:strand:- start:74 stop:667 length:594 start_codon:yes stop_codon:yes gene_type:complete
MLPEFTNAPIDCKRKFHTSEVEENFNITDFWQWNQSNLLENRTRGILAEYLVMKALSLQSHSRKEWENWDLITSEGVKIEIKSASYIQSWRQSNYSNITFNIRETKRFNPDTNTYAGTLGRHSDVYIFCLLHCKDQSSIDPMDLNQWSFFIIPTAVLNQNLGGQKTIGLKRLNAMAHANCSFHQLKEAFQRVVDLLK